jgi:hypothetical protein
MRSWILGISLVVLLSSIAMAQNVPRVTITTPTSASTYTTTTTPLFVGGTARDNKGVTQVTWVNDRGGMGTAQGTTVWSASIVIQPGLNRLTVQAVDAENHQGQDSLAVMLMAPPLPPGPITVQWSYGGLAGDSFQMERCAITSQDCPMGVLTQVSISQRELVDTAVAPNSDYCYRMAVLIGGTVGTYSNTLCSHQ